MTTNAENNPPWGHEKDYGSQVPCVLHPKYDPYFQANKKILHDLLVDESIYYQTPSYCVAESTHHAVLMRQELMNWLREVIVFRNSDFEVLTTAGQLVDRYLLVGDITRQNYQLVAATCLLISSKIKEVCPICVKDVVDYAANSITVHDVLNTEILIGSFLGWDLNCLSPLEFIKPTIDFLPFPDESKRLICATATKLYIKVFHIETISQYLPSYVSSACILYAIQLSVSSDYDSRAHAALSIIIQLLGHRVALLREVLQLLTNCFDENTSSLRAMFQVKSAVDQTSDSLDTSAESQSRTSGLATLGNEALREEEVTDLTDEVSAPLADSTGYASSVEKKLHGDFDCTASPVKEDVSNSSNWQFSATSSSSALSVQLLPGAEEEQQAAAAGSDELSGSKASKNDWAVEPFSPAGGSPSSGRTAWRCVRAAACPNGLLSVREKSRSSVVTPADVRDVEL